MDVPPVEFTTYVTSSMNQMCDKKIWGIHSGGATSDLCTVIVHEFHGPTFTPIVNI